MITAGEASVLMKRFSAQERFDFLTEDARAEIMLALMEARDAKHAEEATEWLLQASADRPTPFHVRQALEAHPEPARAIADRSCALCYGTGFEHHWHERLEIWHASRVRPASTASP